MEMGPEVFLGVMAIVVGLQTFWIDRAIRRGTDDHRVFEEKFEKQNERMLTIETTLAAQGEAIKHQGEAIRKQGEAIGKQGEAITKQSEAITKQGEAIKHLLEGKLRP